MTARDFVPRLLGVVVLGLSVGALAAASEKPSPILAIRLGEVWDEAAKHAMTTGGARPFACGYAYSRSEAFDIDAGFARDLDKGAISAELRDALTANLAKLSDVKLRLSESATVQIAGKGPVWLVMDRENHFLLYVEKGRNSATATKNMLQVYFDSPYWSMSHWTLSNGLSIGLRIDRLQEKDPLRVTSLSIANSTALFSCKGESWYPVQEVELYKNNTCRLVCLAEQQGPPNSDSRQRPAPVYLWKGMSGDAALKALDASKLKPLPMDSDWKKQYPKSGRWLRYSLDGHTALAVNLDSESERTPPSVRWIIIEAARSKDGEKTSATYRVECELVDLRNPLRPDWDWAFGAAWSWDPNDPDRMQRLKETGQRRWTEDQQSQPKREGRKPQAEK
jgi:hypothetical protein